MQPCLSLYQHEVACGCIASGSPTTAFLCNILRGCSILHLSTVFFHKCVQECESDNAWYCAANPNATSFNEDCDPTISEFGCDDSTGNPDLQEGVRGDYDDTPGPASAGVDTDGAPTEADADPFADDELFQSIGGGNNGRGFTA